MLKNTFEYNSFSFGISFSRNGKIFSVSVLSFSAEKKRENSERDFNNREISWRVRKRRKKKVTSGSNKKTCA